MKPQDVAFFVVFIAIASFGIWHTWYINKPDRSVKKNRSD
jgi:hypothetical protein